MDEGTLDIQTGAKPARDDDLQRIRNYLEAARRENRIRLPAEPALAQELGITRGRLRALLKRLEQEELIWRHVGKGTFIGQRTLTGDGPSLANLINPLESFEARMVLEPQIAALAALRASPSEVEELKECLQRMRPITDFDEWAQWDGRLHRTLAKAAHNTLLLALYETVRQSSPTGMQARLQQVYELQTREDSNKEHEEFITAIASRDPDRAETLMRQHLRSVRNLLFGDR